MAVIIGDYRGRSGLLGGHMGDPRGPSCTIWDLRFNLDPQGSLGPSEVDRGRPWSTMVDPGRPWSTLVHDGRPLSTIVDHDRPWSLSSECRVFAKRFVREPFGKNTCVFNTSLGGGCALPDSPNISACGLPTKHGPIKMLLVTC